MAHNKSTMMITRTARGRGSVLAASSRAFLRFNRGVLALPLPLQGWVLMLVGVNIVAPTFFFEHAEARVVLAAGVTGLVLMTMLTARFGFSRILGLGHILWAPMIVYLWGRLDQVGAQDAFGLWLWTVILMDAISLLFDGADVWRFLRGERGETVSGLDAAAQMQVGA